MTNNKNLKRNIIIIAVIVVLMLLSLYSIGVFGLGGKTQFKKEYKESIPNNNLYKYVSQFDVLELLDSGTGILYLGYSESPWCKRIVSVLNEAAFANDISKIYYYDIKNDRDSLSLNEDGEVNVDTKSTNFYNELLKKFKGFTEDYILLDKDGNQVDTGKERIYVPFVAFIRNGKIVFVHSDIVESYTDTSKELTKDQWDELYNIYEKGIKLINEK